MPIFMDNDMIIVIVGPTSSGKSRVALEVASRIDSEIVSCDSMQIYRGMDILTRVPSGEELKKVKHHFVNIIDPGEEYNAARYSVEARTVINKIISGGKAPLVVGGTGLYLRTLLDGIFNGPVKDEELRKELIARADKEGKEVLYDRLRLMDPVTAAKLHPNDLKRVTRAIEVYELTGRPMSEKKIETAGEGIGYAKRIFGLALEREMMYERINKSVDKMFDEGIIEEVRALEKGRLSETASKAIGIKEIGAYLRGEWDIDTAREEMKKNTRHYAKRQITWFRADNRIEWVDAMREPKEIAREILFKVTSNQ
ncbi:MAG: tRNA (adenosine(37)-N6)-dimethylallyltransferase MiaA [Candidatus Omnitrophica bacterium]|nr:tRNA (adenosine(37)-N6)-dimethylallyltransferase MiaA [Candidatus Omnitrophota bacterium]